jgi:hypothetical protein
MGRLQRILGAVALGMAGAGQQLLGTPNRLAQITWVLVMLAIGAVLVEQPFKKISKKYA